MRNRNDTTNALEVEHLSVSFGATDVLRDLSFEVRRGTSLAIVGPNGAGKSVLFRALAGSIPYRGVVRWAPGTRLGYVPQKLDIERDLPITGGDLLNAKAALARASKADAGQALARVGLGSELLRESIGGLSGGQFQRLLVALALIGNPNVLLLDEPAAGVDAPGQAHLNDAIRSLQEEKGVTVLLISHDLAVVYRYATRVLCLSRRLACVGEPHEVLTPETLYELYGTRLAFHVHDESRG